MLPLPLRIVPVKLTMTSGSLYSSEQANCSSLTISVGGNETNSFLVIVSVLGTLLGIVIMSFKVIPLGRPTADDSVYFYFQQNLKRYCNLQELKHPDT